VASTLTAKPTSGYRYFQFSHTVDTAHNYYEAHIAIIPTISI
jgi:hypothetical protein